MIRHKTNQEEKKHVRKSSLSSIVNLSHDSHLQIWKAALPNFFVTIWNRGLLTNSMFNRSR